MKKQIQGSKKKARRLDFIERESRRQREKHRKILESEMLESGDIELMAKAMGIKI